MSTDGPATGPGAPPPPPPSLVAWLWRYVRPHRGKFLAALVLMALEGSMLGALSWSIRPMFDRVFIGGDRLALGLVAGGLLTVFVVRGLAGFGQRVLMVMIGQRVAARIQSDMVRHLVGLDSAYFLETPPGTLIERVRGDSAAATTLPAGVVAALGRDGVSLLSLFLVALWIDWLWTLIALAAAPLIMLPAGRLHRRVGAAARQGRVIAARLATHLDETFHGINAIKLSGTEARAGDRYDAEIGGFVRAQVRAERNQAGISALMDIIAGVGLFGVLSYGGAQIIAGTRTVGDFMAFFTAMGLVFEPLRRIGNVAGVWAAARASLERLHAILALRPTILGPAAPVALPARVAAADIVFDDVHFAYGETPALRGLGFTARAGQTTALVGPSGAGKSTVFTLLARLADPQAGAITLGGVAIDRFALADLRGVFSVVAQDTALFDESLRENIVMGADCTAEALAAAVEAAHVREFAAALPQGLETRVGPRGAALSGGQRQRVAIARALLRDSPVLLLDEATSALDAASEAAVQGALARLSAGRTTLVIAHRLATIAGADRILVLDGGRVVDSGTHHELLARGGLYAALCGTQFAGT